MGPLTALTSTKVRWKWTQECQEAFETIKKVVSREVILSFPDFSEPFEIHCDASKVQLVAVISQYGKSIAFYSIKLNPA